MRPFVVYHGNCADGFGAAWVLWKHFKGEADFYPGVYQRRPPEVEDRQLIFVDFAYKRDVMLALAQKNRFTLVLDHHKSAMEDLEPVVAGRHDPQLFTWDGFMCDCSWDSYVTATTDDPAFGFITTVFDMKRSGAGIAWDFFNPKVPRPRIIDHIEDRDLWRFKLPDTRAVQASMFSLPYDFERWNQRIWGAEETWSIRNQIIDEGEAIERKHHKDIGELIEVVTRPMRFRIPLSEMQRLVLPIGFPVTVPVANLPYTLTSDAGHLLCERNWYGMTPESEAEYLKNGGAERITGGYQHPFAACYWDKPDGRQFSLRSRDDGADVSEIAKLYGGGGHARASGFLVPYSRLEEFEL